MNGIWEEVKKHVKSELPEKSFALWIDPISLMEQTDNTFVLGCPNKFSRNWITENYLCLLEKNLDKIGHGNYNISFKVKTPKKRKSAPDVSLEAKQLTLPNIPPKRGNGRRWLNNEFTFDRFIVGQCNEFAFSASKAMALEHKKSHHSLFMVANTGLGKSHLSQAIGQTILAHDARTRVYYISAEDFVNEMIFALKNNRIDEFKDKYRQSCDVLLLEDVHFLSGKLKSQAELGYTLDALSNSQKKIIFTSSLLPKDIPSMSRELSSRLTSGIIATIDCPDYQTRVKILAKKSVEQDLCFSEEIVHLLAKQLTRDIRQLESALKCIKAKSELLNIKIDVALAKEVIQSQSSQKQCISTGDILKLVCQYFKVDPETLKSKSRKKIHSFPREVYIYLCRNHTDTSLESIGRTINRKHSTMVYASEVIERKMKIDHKVKNQVDFLNDRLKSTSK